MTDDELIARVRELEKNTKPAPWIVNGEEWCAINTSEGFHIAADIENNADAKFIAEMRILAPDLARRLQKANERIKDLENEVEGLRIESNGVAAAYNRVCRGEP